MQAILFRFANSLHSGIYKQALLQTDQYCGEKADKPGSLYEFCDLGIHQKTCFPPQSRTVSTTFSCWRWFSQKLIQPHSKLKMMQCYLPEHATILTRGLQRTSSSSPWGPITASSVVTWAIVTGFFVWLVWFCGIFLLLFLVFVSGCLVFFFFGCCLVVFLFLKKKYPGDAIKLKSRIYLLYFKNRLTTFMMDLHKCNQKITNHTLKMELEV